MKKPFFGILFLICLHSTGLACPGNDPGRPCEILFYKDRDTAADAQLEACNGSLLACLYDILPVLCTGPYEITDSAGYVYRKLNQCSCGFEDDYSFCTTVPPIMCVGGGQYCFYYRVKPPEEECCPSEEQQSKMGMCCDGKKCPQDQAGDPIFILSGNNREVDTDLEFATPSEKGFKFYRTYNSQFTFESFLGYGWTHNYNVIMQPMGSEYADAYIIIDESSRPHYYQNTTDLGLYLGIMSTKGYLAEESDGTYTWHRANGITYTFDANFKFIAKQDGNGNVQTLTYDTNDLLETVTDEATGRSIGFVYNIDGRIDHITGPVTNAVTDGVWVSYQYDTNGNLTHVIYADDNNGSTASGFEYSYEDTNDLHNLTEKSNLAGEFLSRWAYDSEDRAYENVTRDGKGVSIAGYGTSSVVVTDAQGVQKTYTIDTINGRKTITNVTGSGCASCGGDIVRYGYDDQRRVNEVEYANGRIDTYSDFDDNDRYHTETQNAGTQDARTFYYDYHPDTGDKLYVHENSVLATGDKETLWDYDDDGNSIANEAPTRLVHRKIERGYTYDASGSVASYEYITTYDYDANGNVTEIDGPPGRRPGLDLLHLRSGHRRPPDRNPPPGGHHHVHL